MKMKKTILLIFMIALLSACAVQEGVKPLKIGAILPLTGHAAITGEMVKNAMELAADDLAQKGIEVEILYEDSQGQARLGIAAYNKLKKIDKVDVVLVAFSRVAIPLISLAEQDETPLIMTLVAAKGAANMSDYAFRFWSDETQYAYPHFDIFTKKEYENIALLYVNDEYGYAVSQAMKEKAEENGVTIVADEKFEVGTTDFRTHLLKIKASNPDGILLVVDTPPGIINILTQAKELVIQSEIFEASPYLNVKGIRAALGGAAEDAFTIGYPFSLKQTGKEFSQKYFESYDTYPLFMAPFGYDMVNLIAEATQGQSLSGEEIKNKILALEIYRSLNGPLDIQPNGEINPPTFSVQIKNDEMVLVK